jgi:hypothetical protein
MDRWWIPELQPQRHPFLDDEELQQQRVGGADRQLEISALRRSVHFWRIPRQLVIWSPQRQLFVLRRIHYWKTQISNNTKISDKIEISDEMEIVDETEISDSTEISYKIEIVYKTEIVDKTEINKSSKKAV